MKAGEVFLELGQVWLCQPGGVNLKKDGGWYNLSSYFQRATGNSTGTGTGTGIVDDDTLTSARLSREALSLSVRASEREPGLGKESSTWAGRVQWISYNRFILFHIRLKRPKSSNNNIINYHCLIFQRLIRWRGVLFQPLVALDRPALLIMQRMLHHTVLVEEDNTLSSLSSWSAT